MWSIQRGLVLAAAMLSPGCLVDVDASPDLNRHRAASSALWVSAGATRGETVDETSRCFGKKPTIVGTDDADDIEGTKGRDVIVTLAGADLVSGLRNDDAVCAGTGDDER